jgi:hypothetical protein
MKKILFFLLISTAAFAQPYNGAPKSNTTPQGNETGMLVRSIPQDIDRISFAKTITNNVDSDWGAVVVTGSGMTINQTGGNLVITSGTTARAETIIRSNKSSLGGIRLNVRSTLSQRIINQNFFVEMVDVIGDGLAYNITSATTVVVTIPSNPFTAVNVGQSVHLGAFNGTGTFLGGRYPIASVSGNDVTFTVSGFAAGTGTCSVFGWNYYQLRYQGTTATQVDFDTQRNGWNTGFTTATINSTAAPGHLAIVTANDLKSSLSDQLVASSGTIQVTPRASRVENVPDDANLRVQVRVQNLATAPASTTTFTIGMIAVARYANQDVVIQDIRPTGPFTGLMVDIVRAVTLAVSGTVTANIGTGSIAAGTNAVGDVGVQYRANATGAALFAIINSPATPATQSVKGSAGRIVTIYAVNSNAATRWLKVFNTASPTLGTTAAVLDIPIPPNSSEPVSIKLEGGLGLSAAIVIAVTGAKGTTDNTAITLNDVGGFIAYQ